VYRTVNTTTDLSHPVGEERKSEERKARRGLAIFLAVVLLATAPLLWLVIRSGKPVEELIMLILPLMWVPAIASVVARVLNHEGFDDISFRLRDKGILLRLLLAVVFPVIVGVCAYGTAWLAGLATFAAPDATNNPLLTFLTRLAIATTIGPLIGIISAAGEEIGWRGYMTTRLVKANIPAPIVTGGLIWGIWHIPGILSGQYAAGPYPWISALFFMGLAITMTILWSTWRLETGSVWPAIIGHAAWNAIIQGPFDTFTQGEQTAHWVGESGILVVGVAILVTWLYLRKPAGISKSTPSKTSLTLC
jgi:membrane protease YdiL (CAAX protease family)